MLKYATPELYAEIDKKSAEYKERILGTKTEIKYTGTAYYVSEKGDDNNDGKSPESAWRTNEKVSNAELLEGDAVFFERGGLFRGQIKTTPGVTYSAYGEGEKPKIYAYKENCAIPEKWELVDDKAMIWKYTDETSDIGLILFDDGKEIGNKLIPSYVDGKFVCRNDNSVEFNPAVHLAEDFDYYHHHIVESSNPANPDASLGPRGGHVFIKCTLGNPGEIFKSIEFSPRFNLILIGRNNNVVIDNLCIKFAGCHGVGAGTCDGLTVKNCEIGWIGGCIQYYTSKGSIVPFGNGVEIYGGCHNYTVSNNWIYECYDAGITHQVQAHEKYIEMFDIEYCDNLIENCVYSIEYFLSRLTPENTETTMKNVLMARNIMRFSGFGFGKRRPGHANAHIKGWSAHNPSKNFVIEDNIMDRATDMLIHVGFSMGDKVIMRNNTYIQYPNGEFGRYETDDLIRYDIEKIDKIAEEKTGEVGAKYYIAY